MMIRMRCGGLIMGMVMICGLNTQAQQAVKIDSNYANSYYLQRVEYFNQMSIPKNAIVFLGNSITERGEWQEILADSPYPIINRGVGGDNSFGILARMERILLAKPRSIFLMDGINDLFRKLPNEVSVNNYRKIIHMIKLKSPKTKIYIESALPINEEMTREPYTKGRNKLVLLLNEKIKAMALEEQITYINICPVFQDEAGHLRKDITPDGVHLKASAYIDWVAYLKAQKYL
jgi:lysophospholipase L1-like esterase